MDKGLLIDNFRHDIESTGSEDLHIPEDHINEFWSWFKDKSLYFWNTEKIIIKQSQIDILTNGCFRNSFRISKAFPKQLFYFEGFNFREMGDSFKKHAFNVNKRGNLQDYTLDSIKTEDPNQVYRHFVGCKIPLSFMKKLYKNRDGKFVQYSGLVPYFMKINDIPDYINYSGV